MDEKGKTEIIDIKLNKDEKEIKANNKKNYLLIFSLIAFIYFAIVISTEITYRKKLFEKSIEYQEDLREKYDKKSAFYDCWKFFSFFGTNVFCFAIYFVIFIFLPLNSSFLVLQTLNFSNYITNILKMIYRNPRPYWESDILDIVCNSGYGNPSGHSLICLSNFLVISHIFTNFEFFRKNQKGKILRIVIFGFLIILAFLVIISRTLLSAHSINQIIYGSLLGIGIYFFEIYIISYHTYSSEEFIKHIINKNVVIIYSIIYAVLIILLLIIYFSIDNDKYIKNLVYNKIFNGERCDRKRKFQLLKNDGFTQSLAITSIVGAHLGIILLLYVLKKLKYKIDFINEFNRSSIKRWFIRLPILIVSGIFLILYYVIPKSSPLGVIILFKFAVPFFLTAFCIHFIGIFICILKFFILKNK